MKYYFSIELPYTHRSHAEGLWINIDSPWLGIAESKQFVYSVSEGTEKRHTPTIAS